MSATVAASRPWPFDPFGYGIELPLSGSFCPLGYPLELSTNSPDVLLAAKESWSGFPQFFSEPPIELRILVPDGPGEHAGRFDVRAQRHLLCMVSDMRNFAVCDPAGHFAYAFVTRATAEDRAWFRYFYLESIANLTLWTTHLTRIHAGCVGRNGHGVLLCGESGAGKSCLTYACARRGWLFVSDEAPSIVRRSSERIVIGKPHQIHLRETAFELFPELKQYPIKVNPIGKISFEVNTEDLPNISKAYRTNVAALVFLQRGHSGPARMTPLAKEEAWRRLEADLPLFAEPAHEEHQAALRNLLGAETLELRYRDLDPAIEQLETLVR